MFKINKNKIIYFSIFFVLFICTLILVPLLFKQKIKQEVLNYVDKQIDADFNFSRVSISPLRHIPYITVSFHDVIVAGHQDFKYDTLLRVHKLSASFNLFNVITKNNIEIRSIHLEKPIIKAIVLEDSTANFNIFPEKIHQSHTDSNYLSINIEKWDILDGKISYVNKLTNLSVEVNKITHKGKGNFNKNDSKLKLFIESPELSIISNNISFLDKKELKADLDLQLDLKNNKVIFQNKQISINHFKFLFDGDVSFLKNELLLNVNYQVEKTDFKDFLSIMPSFYMHNIHNVTTDGSFVCNGYVRGFFDGKDKIPAYHLRLIVHNGMFQYPTLPKSVENINLACVVNNVDGNPENFSIQIDNMHMDMDKNHISGRLYAKGDTNLYINSNIKAELDLAQIENMFPLKEFILKGNLIATIETKGIYNHKNKKFPFIDAFLELKNGYIKSSKNKIPLEKIHCNAEVINTTGEFKDTQIGLNKVSFILDDEPFNMIGIIEDLTDFRYEFSIKGLIDFDKITKIYPIKNTVLKGILETDFETIGSLKDLKDNNFNKLSTSGQFELKNIYYKSAYIAQSIKINDAILRMKPHSVIIEKFDSHIGKDNINLTGFISDYMPYLLNKTTILKGSLNIKMDTLNVNSWKKLSKDTLSSKIFQIPKNYDFVFNSDIKHFIFGKSMIDDIKGDISIKNGILSFKETTFDYLDSDLKLNGFYDSRSKLHPIFDITVGINNLNIATAYATLVPIKKTTSILYNTTGFVSGKYHLTGELNSNFMPLCNSIKGNGKLLFKNVVIKELDMMSSISKITKNRDLMDPVVGNISVETEIDSGKVFVKPFKFKIKHYNIEFSGTHTFNDQMNYVFKLSRPPLNKIKIPFHINGSLKKPIIKLGKGHENYQFEENN